MKQPLKALGVVLAGGQSRRMGHTDKTLMSFAGTPLAKHVLDRIEPQVDAVIINTNADAALFETFDVPVLPDTVQGFAGPLAGVLTALQYASENQFTQVVSVAADTPFFPGDFVEQLVSAGTYDIVLAGSGGHRQPTFGLWSVAIKDDLERFLTEGEERKIMRFVQQHTWATVEFETDKPEAPDPFFNINTPEDMKQALNYMTSNEATNA